MLAVAVPLRETASGRGAEDFDDHVMLMWVGAARDAARSKTQFQAANGRSRNSNGGRWMHRPPRRCLTLSVSRDVNLDDVDFGRQVARDFETNFLLADGRLGPDLHDGFLSFWVSCVPNSQTLARVHPLVQTLFLCGTNLRIKTLKSSTCRFVRYKTSNWFLAQINSLHDCV
jgi:hypothetical protein